MTTKADVKAALDKIAGDLSDAQNALAALPDPLPAPPPPPPASTFLTTIYIDPTAATNGNGTFASPKNTWSGQTLNGNVAYLQKEGTTYIGSLTLNGGGTGLGKELLLGTYKAGNGARVLDGTNRAKINVNHSASNGILTYGSVYLIIESLEVYDNDTNGGLIHTGVGNLSHHHQSLRYCYVHGNPNTAAGAQREGEGIMAFCDNFTIDHCIVDNVSGDGIYVEGDNTIIAYSTIGNVSVPNGLYGDCIQIASSQMSSNDCWIHDNNCKNVVAVKQAIILNEGGKGATGGVVEFNTCVGPGAGADCWGIEANFPGMKIRGNNLSNYRRGIDMQGNASDSEVSANVISYSGNQSNVRGINVYGASKRLKMFDNKLTNTSGLTATGIGIFNGAEAQLDRNIFSGWNPNIAKDSSSVITGTQA